MDFNFDELTDKLASSLSHERFLHSIGVAHTAVMLAKKHGADLRRAAAAGLVHDCAKGFGREELFATIESRKLDLEAEDLENLGMLHAPVGAAVAEEKYAITDPEVLDAIRYHPTGKIGASDTLQILMLADYCEPSRDHPGIEKAREALKDNLRLSLKKVLSMKLNHIRSKGRLPHSRSVSMLASLEN